MVTERTLAGRQILVTRPRHQADHLAQLIRDAGGAPLLFPVIEIVTIAKENWQQQTLNNIDWMMFVSPNAVNGFCQQWLQPIPDSIKLTAIGGQATADAMLQAGLRVDSQPPPATGSDGLIELPELQYMQGQQVMIVRGDGGRALLADTLAERGANIVYAEVYRRALPEYDEVEIQQALRADMLISTSQAGLDNLLQLLGNESVKLKQKPLVVFSERIRQYAIKAGFNLVSVTSDFSDEAVVASLIEMDKQHG